MREAERAAAFSAWRREQKAPMASETEATKPGLEPIPAEQVGRAPLREVKRHEAPERRREERVFQAAISLSRKEQNVGGRWVEVPGPNEDNAFADEEHGLFGVFDGMGGYAGGEKASAIARETFATSVPGGLERVFDLPRHVADKYSRRGEEVDRKLSILRNFVEVELDIEPRRFADGDDAEQALLGALMLANSKIKEAAPNAGTTASVMVVYETVEGELRAKIANRGDSRIYRYQEGVLEQVTKDDSLVQEMLDQGWIKDDEDISAVLPKKARTMLRRYVKSVNDQATIKDIRNIVTAGLGADSDDQVARTKILNVDLKPGDLIFAVTDGIGDNLTMDRLREVVEKHKQAHTDVIADAIAQAAKEVSRSDDPRAKQDDMGVVVASVYNVQDSLNAALERHRAYYEERYGMSEQSSKDPERYPRVLTQELVRFTTIRNQLETAMKSYPKNEKLKALHDHIMMILRFIGDRQAEFAGKITKRYGEDETLRLNDRRAA